MFAGVYIVKNWPSPLGGGGEIFGDLGEKHEKWVLSFLISPKYHLVVLIQKINTLKITKPKFWGEKNDFQKKGGGKFFLGKYTPLQCLPE